MSICILLLCTKGKNSCFYRIIPEHRFTQSEELSMNNIHLDKVTKINEILKSTTFILAHQDSVAYSDSGTPTAEYLTPFYPY
jgi:hypothetical protein